MIEMRCATLENTLGWRNVSILHRVQHWHPPHDRSVSVTQTAPQINADRARSVSFHYFVVSEWQRSA